VKGQGHSLMQSNTAHSHSPLIANGGAGTLAVSHRPARPDPRGQSRAMRRRNRSDAVAFDGMARTGHISPCECPHTSREQSGLARNLRHHMGCVVATRTSSSIRGEHITRREAKVTGETASLRLWHSMAIPASLEKGHPCLRWASGRIVLEGGCPSGKGVGRGLGWLRPMPLGERAGRAPASAKATTGASKSRRRSGMSPKVRA
jgi:hypothetical protein